MRIRTIAAAFVVAAPLLALGSPRLQLAGIQAIATGILRLPTTAVASVSAGLATGASVGAVATDTERLAFAGWVLAVGVGR